MKLSVYVRAGFALAAVSIASTAAAAPQPVTGRWLDQSRSGVIQIAPCGAALCGRLVQVLKPGGQGATDSNNPNPALRRRPIQGITILSGFTAEGDSWRGQIYDPRRGRTFKSFVKLNPNGSLSVKGCMGPICQTQTWTRAR